MKITPEDPCPCGNLKSYRHCCLPFHNESSLPDTAEALMRSRFTAFCTENLSYLFNSWHPAHRPPAAEILSGTTRYISLQITDTKQGRPENNTGEVTFVVRYIEGDRLYTMQEKSSFVKQQGKWLYLEGDNALHSVTLKKNSPCPCGSGKKFKRCCGIA